MLKSKISYQQVCFGWLLTYYVASTIIMYTHHGHKKEDNVITRVM